MRGISVFSVTLTFALALAVALTFTGCSDEPVSPADPLTSTTGLVDGKVDPGAGSFELEIQAAGEGRIAGPFILRGSNIHYDDALGALVVDLTVTNRGTVAHPEPVSLTFVSLLPETVTVGNPDNGVNGPGAMIVFSFANDDGMWTPRETSEPRTVEFIVGPGVSIGFVARLDVGVGGSGGAIGGVVWNDADEDGMMDRGEPGIGGVPIFLTGGPPDAAAVAVERHTRTREDGSYVFDGLGPGLYVVTRGALEDCFPTTPTVINVVLVMDEGVVSDFLMANFGCVPHKFDVRIEVGDYVRVTGAFQTNPSTNADGGVLVAREIVVTKCGDRGCALPGVLRGEVTAVEPDQKIRVMTEWINFAERDSMPPHVLRAEIDPADVKVGDRVEAIVVDDPMGVDDPLHGQFLYEWSEAFDQANGYVKRIGGDTAPYEFIVLRHMRIRVTPDTRIHADMRF